MKNKPANRTTNVDTTKDTENSNNSPDAATAAKKSNDRKKPTKSQVGEKKPKNNDFEGEREVQENKAPKKQEAKKGIKNFFKRPKKDSDQSNQAEENDEVVQRDRAPKSMEQNKPWDGVSPQMKESWDEKCATKKQNGKGNEPLAICAAPPDDEEPLLLTGGDPLLAICAAEPLLAICAAEAEEDDVGGNGKPLLAICAAEPNENTDAFSVDDVSESETMVSDDEVEDEISEVKTVGSDEILEEVDDLDEVEDIAEPYTDDVSESETADSEIDDVSTSDGDDEKLGDENTVEEIEEDNVNIVTENPDSHVDDVSESETAASDEGEDVVVEEAMPVARSDANTEQHLPTTSNKSIATIPSALYEKSNITMGQLDRKVEPMKPEPVAKKELKVLSDDERRKCYMWYDRMGRPTRDKMKQRIPLMKDCDITLEDVDALPWMMRGAMISQSELNKLILK